MLFFSFLSCQNLEKKESFTSHMRQEEQGPTVSSCPDLDLQAFSSVILPQLKKKLGEWISFPILYKVTYNGISHYILGSIHTGVDPSIQTSMTDYLISDILPEVTDIYFEDRSGVLEAIDTDLASSMEAVVYQASKSTDRAYHIKSLEKEGSQKNKLFSLR